MSGKGTKYRVANHQHAEPEYKADIKALLEFINRLGNVSRGLSTEIDQKLSKIKAVSAFGDNRMEELKYLFTQTAHLLQNEHSRLENELAHSHSLAINAVQWLLSHDQTSPQREALLKLSQRLEAPLHSYSELLPLLVESIAAYRAHLTSIWSLTDKLPNNEINHFQLELASTLGSVDFHGKSSHALKNIYQRLSHKINQKQLLQCCIESIQVVINGLNSERKSSQHFLQALSDALTSLNTALIRAVRTQEQSSQVQSQLNESLNEQISVLHTTVEESESLQALKQKVHQQVQTLSDTLNQKLEAETLERTRLQAQLNSMQARLEDVEHEAEAYRNEVSEQKFKSMQDSLTRQPNRAAFEERIQLEFKRWQSYAYDLALAIVDIDHFKVINDTYGHTAGDKTLQVIANMLKESLRKTDFVCRYGGEEFVIVFPQTKLEVAYDLIEKARHRIKNIPFKFRNKSISITISAGVSNFSGNDVPTSVFERADRALYDAKHQGRDRVCQK